MKKMNLPALLITIFLICNPVLNAENLKAALKVLSTYRTNVHDESAAEIVDFDASSKRVFFVNAHFGSIEILDVKDIKNPVKIKDVDFKKGNVNSLSIHDSIVACVVEAKIKQSPGEVVFLDIDGNILARTFTGPLPDMVTFTPDGDYVLIANEGQPNDGYDVDPKGCVSIISISKTKKSVKIEGRNTVYFKKSDLVNDVRITGPAGTTVAQDLEPEYITVSSDSRYAYVSLQENNAIAKIEIASGTVLMVKGLGLKDHSRKGNALDAVNDKSINIKNYPVFGMYMPDAIAYCQIKGKSYVLSANEGDGREYGEGGIINYTDEFKVKNMKLDPKVFAGKEDILKELAGFKVSSEDGDIDNDGDIDKLCGFGARSFSIWDSNLDLVYDSGDDFEKITAEKYPKYFNASNSKDKFDDRSKSKGPEPEGIEVAEINNNFFAFVLLERIGGIMVYNISNPKAPVFNSYLNNRKFGPLNNKKFADAGDLGPEGVKFISADKSPHKKPMLIVANEVSGTVTFYDIIIK